jgi:hypothetical protein
MNRRIIPFSIGVAKILGARSRVASISRDFALVPGLVPIVPVQIRCKVRQ